MTGRRAVLLLVAAIVVAVLVVVALWAIGRPQVGALARPAGATETLVRVAGNDVLSRDAVPIGRAPVCTADPTTVTCTGDTLDGRPIRIEGPATPPPGPLMITVRVGEQVATEDAQAVVDAAGSAP